jgi:hypothetical protein
MWTCCRNPLATQMRSVFTGRTDQVYGPPSIEKTCGGRDFISNMSCNESDSIPGFQGGVSGYHKAHLLLVHRVGVVVP